jgi:hypothetical protein
MKILMPRALGSLRSDDRTGYSPPRAGIRTRVVRGAFSATGEVAPRPDSRSLVGCIGGERRVNATIKLPPRIAAGTVNGLGLDGLVIGRMNSLQTSWRRTVSNAGTWPVWHWPRGGERVVAFITIIGVVGRHKGRLTTTNILLVFSSTHNNIVFKKIILYVIVMAPSTSPGYQIPRTTALIREDVRLNLTSEGN